jgi:hypothetical protein
LVLSPCHLTFYFFNPLCRKNSQNNCLHSPSPILSSPIFSWICFTQTSASVHRPALLGVLKYPLSEDHPWVSKLMLICCPQHRQTKADTLKQLRPIGEGDQELEKRLVQEELT